MADTGETYDTISVDRDKLTKLEALVNDIMSAFPKDDTGSPDFSGHRTYHRDIMVKEEEYKKSRADIKKNVQTWAIIGLLTVLASSLAQAFLVPLLHAIKAVTTG